MAMNENLVAFHCTKCQKELILESKTLPCLHSYCDSCLNQNLEDEKNRNCPKCKETFTLDQLSSSPFLAKSLRHRQLESMEWNCNLCSEDGIKSLAKNWCRQCQKLLCENCNRFHNKFQENHILKDLDEIERTEAVEMMMVDKCLLHGKLFCEQCDTRCGNHSTESRICLPQPLSVREEALKQLSDGPTLEKKISDIEDSFTRANESIKQYVDQLNLECESTSLESWHDFELIMENMTLRTHELCKDMKENTDEQVRRWHGLIDEKDRILKELGIWRLKLHQILTQDHEDMQVIYWLRLLRSKLSTWMHQSVEPIEKCQLEVVQANWWVDASEHLKRDQIGSLSLRKEKLPANNIESYKQWDVLESNAYVYSLYVSKEDKHVFISNFNKRSIIEFTEHGEVVCECKLFGGSNKFYPWDMCLICPDIYAVCSGNQNSLIFLERSKNPPFLKIKKIVSHDKTSFFSVCKMDEMIFTCDFNNRVDSFTIQGKNIKTVKSEAMESNYFPLIRADPSTGNFWLTEINSSVLFCFNSNGEKIRSVNTEEHISDFFLNEFGHLYFCNEEGIFCISPEKNLCRFEKKSEFRPRIFVLGNEIFIAIKINGQYLIKIFQIYY